MPDITSLPNFVPLLEEAAAELQEHLIASGASSASVWPNSASGTLFAYCNVIPRRPQLWGGVPVRYAPGKQGR